MVVNGGVDAKLLSRLYGEDGSWELRLRLGNMLAVPLDEGDTRISLKDWARSGCWRCWPP